MGIKQGAHAALNLELDRIKLKFDEWLLQRAHAVFTGDRAVERKSECNNLTERNLDSGHFFGVLTIEHQQRVHVPVAGMADRRQHDLVAFSDISDASE